jgi:hypothetical protein
LKVLFQNNAGEWVLVKSYGGTNLAPFQQEIIDLDTAPNGGGSYFFNQFQVRLEAVGRSHPVLPRNDWFIDNIYWGAPAPVIALSQDSVLFDTTAVAASDTLVLEIQNIGLQNFDVTDIVPPPGGTFTVDRSSFTVAFGAHENVNLVFTPPVSGNYAGVIRIAHNVPGQDTLTVYLEGTTGPPLGISGESTLPKEFAVSQNYPNPFNPNTTIQFQLPKPGEVKLVIYNTLGQKVRTLVNRKFPAGYHDVTWDGRTDLGQRAASGIYIYRFQVSAPSGNAGEYSRVMKMILMK